MPFRPKIGEQISIAGNSYLFTEHPSAKGMPYGQTGRRATVYQLQDPKNGLHALKVFTLAFRSSETVGQAQHIAQFKTIPGLEACQRRVIDPAGESGLIQQQPDLKYAVLMPWVQGLNWQEIILTRRALDPNTSKAVVAAFIQLLASMEQKGIAHCDLSGPNVLLKVNGQSGPVPVSLIDLEDLYGPGLKMPQKLPAGSAGYAHAQVRGGIWSPEADRFAGAVLIAEMLGWCDERVRRIACSEQYFDPGEMQTSSERYQLLTQVIRERWGERLAGAFTRAWFADALKECPSFGDWARALNPPPDPDAIFADLLRAERLGRWTEALGLSDDVLKVDAGRTAVWPIRARAQRLLQMEGEISTAWQRAAASGLTTDWETCLKLVNGVFLVAPQVALYKAQREQAENELETALRLDEIEQQLQSGDWKSAQHNLFAIAPDQPRFVTLKARIEQGVELQSKLEKQRQLVREAFQHEDWQRTLELLQAIERVQPLEPELKNIQTAAAKQQARGKQLRENLAKVQELISVGKYTAAEQLTNEILAEWPDYPTALQRKAEIEQHLARELAINTKLDEARKLIAGDRLQEAQATLAGLLQDSHTARSLSASIAARLEWQEKLAAAQKSWQMSEVLHLLKHRPAGEIDRPEARAAAQRIIQVLDDIQAARRENNLAKEETLLDQLPDDYPQRTYRLEFVRKQLAAHRDLDSGLENYDLELVQRAFVVLDSASPRRQKVSDWLRLEKSRRQQIAMSRWLGNLVDARRLLDEMPPDHPLKEELGQWIVQEETRREQIDAAVEHYDLEAWARLLATLPAEYQLKKVLQERLAEEQARAGRIKLARRLFDAQAVKDELEAVEENYPAYQELSAWAAAEMEREAQIRAALLAGQAAEIEKRLAELPPEHPYTAELREWLEQEHRRAQQAALEEENRQKAILAAQALEAQRLAEQAEIEEQRLAAEAQEERRRLAAEAENEQRRLAAIRQAEADAEARQAFLATQPEEQPQAAPGSLVTAADAGLNETAGAIEGETVAAPAKIVWPQAVMAPSGPTRLPRRKLSRRWLVSALLLVAAGLCALAFQQGRRTVLSSPGGSDPTAGAPALSSQAPAMAEAGTALAAPTHTATASEQPPTSAPVIAPTTMPTASPTSSPTMMVVTTRVREADGMVEVFVPAGEFTMGTDEGWSNHQPAHKVTLDAYWIDQTEVTNGQYAQCIRAGGCSRIAFPDYDSSHKSLIDLDHPVAYVTWKQAQAYCQWVGGGLPTEAEWEKAARGTDERVYPWGDQVPDCSRANIQYCHSETVAVGSFPAGAGPYGTLDMAGNVEEWVFDWYQMGYYQNSPAQNPSGPAIGLTYVRRGGSFADYDDHLQATYRFGFERTPTDFQYTGFRCARGDTPGDRPVRPPTATETATPTLSAQSAPNNAAPRSSPAPTQKQAKPDKKPATQAPVQPPVQPTNPPPPEPEKPTSPASQPTRPPTPEP